MTSNCKYGKLTPDDIKAIYLLLPQFESERTELQVRIAEKPEEFAVKFLSSGFAWAHLYEIPFVEFLGRYFAVTGLDEQVSEAVAGDHPVEALFDLRDSSENMEWTGGSGGQFTYGDLLGYLGHRPHGKAYPHPPPFLADYPHGLAGVVLAGRGMGRTA